MKYNTAKLSNSNTKSSFSSLGIELYVCGRDTGKPEGAYTAGGGGLVNPIYFRRLLFENMRSQVQSKHMI